QASSGPRVVRVDFNADGQSDIVWQNGSTGERVIWLMNGTTLTQTISLGTVSTTWKICGVGDFNSDKKSDLLWRDLTTGECFEWLRDRPSQRRRRSSDLQASAGPLVVGVDFNADGQSDIVWQNSGTGERVIWLMNGAAISSSAALPTTSIEWEFVAADD